MATTAVRVLVGLLITSPGPPRGALLSLGVQGLDQGSYGFLRLIQVLLCGVPWIEFA